MPYKPNIFNCDGNNATFTLKISAINPHPVYDEDEFEYNPQAIVLRHNGPFRPAIAWMQEQRMNSTFGGGNAPETLLLSANNTQFSKFCKLIKFVSQN